MGFDIALAAPQSLSDILDIHVLAVPHFKNELLFRGKAGQNIIDVLAYLFAFCFVLG